MADWTTIPDSSIEPGKPIRSIDGLALRDNPVAIAEGAVGAPRVVNQWFPYNYESSGNGVIFNFSTDGAVSLIQTPNFESGFDYLLLASGLGDSRAEVTSINILLYAEPANTYYSLVWMNLLTANATSDGSALISIPKTSDFTKSILTTEQNRVLTIGTRTGSVAMGRVCSPTVQSVGHARIQSSASGTTINSGSLTLLKRKTNYQEFV
jgi:hypothetical protein